MKDPLDYYTLIRTDNDLVIKTLSNVEWTEYVKKRGSLWGVGDTVYYMGNSDTPSKGIITEMLWFKPNYGDEHRWGHWWYRHRVIPNTPSKGESSEAHYRYCLTGNDIEYWLR